MAIAVGIAVEAGVGGVAVPGAEDSFRPEQPIAKASRIAPRMVARPTTGMYEWSTLME